MNMPEKFDTEFVESWIDKIRFWFLIRKIRREKITALIECNIDKLFYETEMQKWLNYDDTQDRKALAEENRKADNEKNPQRIMELEEMITNAKTVKGGYYKNEKFHNELRTYILMINRWIKQNQNSDI